jgi:hypothetical protein
MDDSYDDERTPFLPRVFGWLLIVLVVLCTGRRP